MPIKYPEEIKLESVEDVARKHQQHSGNHITSSTQLPPARLGEIRWLLKSGWEAEAIAFKFSLPVSVVEEVKV